MTKKGFNPWESIIKFFSEPEAPKEVQEGFGMIEAAPGPDDYTLGGPRQALKTILSRERDYTAYYPPHERQKRNGLDSYSCVVFSGLNAIETIFKAKFGIDINFSDKYIAALIPVTPYRGTTYSKFWDTVRKYGLVLEEDWPWTDEDTPGEYLKRPPDSVIAKGQEFLKVYDIQHEWVDWGGCDPNKLYEALQYGPLQISVNAGALYTRKYNPAINHSIMLGKSLKGKKHFAVDHYSRPVHELPWNFYFGSAKQVSVIKKKEIVLVKVWGLPPVYAVISGKACHISDEYSWQYGAKLGIWSGEGGAIEQYTKQSFDSKFTVGKAISFKK